MRFYIPAVTLLCSVGFGGAQEVSAACYGGGSIALAVILTIIILLLLCGAGYLTWKKYRKCRKGKHLILETDLEKGGEYSFDNPGFRDPGLTPVGKVLEKSNESSGKPKWSNWPNLGAAFSGRSEKTKTLDDSAVSENGVKTVTLRSHDFTGLGFNICGNMRDGIFIKDVLHRGPASESGKLNPGDRIVGVSINFEHIVYEDALTILSYASPYEVIVHSKNGKMVTANAQSGQLAHPLYKSSSSADLFHIGKSAKKRLFQAEETAGNHQSTKTRSNATTLERSDSPKQKQGNKKSGKTWSSSLSPDQLKIQLERAISEDHKQNLKNKQQNVNASPKQEAETQKTDSFHKFGVRVLPLENKKSPKHGELSQNDNNINIEKNGGVVAGKLSIDEVDKTQGKESDVGNETVVETSFKRGGSLTGSGIRRDENGIPQEIPNHMLNAAVAARRNRRPSREEIVDEKTPKKQKGKAPAPPEIQKDEAGPDAKQYESDSDQDDNRSSVNTIELNSSDITVHQAEEEEEDEDMQNRKTVSTGDLTKLHKSKKPAAGTLERAQSLDITDAGNATSKKRKDCNIGSSDSLDGDPLINKEPRLSLILDGLNTFQRSRLKKSTEWGNLEDAILNLNRADSSENSETGEKIANDDSSIDTPEFDALVNKIKEIKGEKYKSDEGDDEVIERTPSNDVTEKVKSVNSLYSIGKTLNDDLPKEGALKKIESEENKDLDDAKPAEDDNDKIKINSSEGSFVIDVMNAVSNRFKHRGETEEEKTTDTTEKLDETETSTDKVKMNETTPDFVKHANASLDLLKSERSYCDDNYYDTNISDEIKISRHTLNNLLETPIKEKPATVREMNVSNITISDDEYLDRKPHHIVTYETYATFTNLSNDQNNSSKNDNDDENIVSSSYDKVFISTPDLIKNVSIAEAIHDLNNEVTIEGPTSLTFEVKSSEVETINAKVSPLKTDESSPADMTYVTEIQVLTPNNKNVSEVEIKSKNLDNEFEKFVKNFEKLDTKSNVAETVPETKREPFTSINDKVDPEKELHKIQEIAEEQLKKLPEMRFTTASYEPSKIPEKRQSQIELLRSNFERSPPKPRVDVTKSRIPIATNKTPPTSPERRDSRNLDLEVDKEIIEIMTSGIAPKNVPKTNTTRNVTVTNIRNYKSPSSLPSYSNRPPVPPRKIESAKDENVIQLNSNGNTESSFKQWVFNPDTSVTNISVTENCDK